MQPREPRVCASGLSEDPPRAELQTGIRLYEQKDYSGAEQVFSGLAQRFPRSGTTLAWRGDAVFYRKDRPEAESARLALPDYLRAGELHSQGCTLPPRARYYQLMGVAYAELRLAKQAEAPLARESLSRAASALETAMQEFPDSAEVPYTKARADCAEAALVPAEGRKELQSRCLEQLGRVVELAADLKRPRFIRIHRSVQDWILRAEGQTEFQSLRQQQGYSAWLKRAQRLAKSSN